MLEELPHQKHSNNHQPQSRLGVECLYLYQLLLHQDRPFHEGISDLGEARLLVHLYHLEILTPFHSRGGHPNQRQQPEVLDLVSSRLQLQLRDLRI